MIKSAIKVFECEIKQLKFLQDNLDQSFESACELILSSTAKVIVIGMGKSGHISNKIAATFASTGTPAFFINAAEAGHGDFGMIGKNDVLIAISNSGSTPEVLSLLPFIKRKGNKLIAITSNEKSNLAMAADIHLNTHIKEEACPYNLAPTSSTTATLVLGDALAIAIMKKRNFTDKDFALSHPSGALGRKLLFTVKDAMLTGNDLPLVSCHDVVSKVISVVTAKELGTAIVLKDKKLLGIFTDGDLRRILNGSINDIQKPVSNFISLNPISITSNILAINALKTMAENKISFLVVVNDQNEPVGAITMKQLIHNGIA